MRVRGGSPEFADVLLLLVVGEDLPAGVGERQGPETLLVLGGSELARLQHAVEPVPGPERGRGGGGDVHSVSIHLEA